MMATCLVGWNTGSAFGQPLGTMILLWTTCGYSSKGWVRLNMRSTCFLEEVETFFLLSGYERNWLNVSSLPPSAKGFKGVINV